MGLNSGLNPFSRCDFWASATVARSVTQSLLSMGPRCFAVPSWSCGQRDHTGFSALSSLRASAGWHSLQGMPRRLTLPHTDLLSHTSEGSWRIAGTRVSIDSVIHGYWNGATPEEICQDFPSLSLAQIYSVIAFYLTHRAAVDAYLKRQNDADRRLRRSLTTHHREQLAALRRRLQKRRGTHTRAA